MHGFREFLKERRIKEMYIPYYVRWITKCYAFLGEEFSARLDGSQEEKFLKQITLIARSGRLGRPTMP